MAWGVDFSNWPKNDKEKESKEVDEKQIAYEAKVVRIIFAIALLLVAIATYYGMTH